MNHLGHLDVTREPDAVVARPVGEIDISNAPELLSALERTVPDTARGLVLDLSDASYLDSAGVRMIFDLERKLGRRRRQLRLVVSAGAPIEKVLKLTRVMWTVPHDPSVWEALARLRAEVELPPPSDRGPAARGGSGGRGHGADPRRGR